MKRFGYLLFLFPILTLMMAGCSLAGNDDEKDLQRLSQIDIYSQSGDLIKSITDESSLQQFSDVIDCWTLQDSESEQNDFEKSVEHLSILYDIVFYKTPASHLNDGKLEEEMRITMYEDSNVVREIISPGNIKNISVSEEYLTFYFSITDEERALFISLAE